jgi:azobenzene reductase
MRLVLVCGSIREGSYTRELLKQIIKNLDKTVCEIDLIDFREIPLPFFDGSLENRALAKPFVQKIIEADGLIIASPEYHNSFSGVLKNAFDFVTSEHIGNKPIAIMATAGGGKGGINCLNGMRTFLRGLYGLVLTEQIIFDNSDFNENLECVNKGSLQKAIDLAQRVISVSNLLKEEKLLIQ